MLPEAELRCDLAQGRVFDQGRAQPAQAPFTGIGALVKNQLGHGHLEDGIAEKFQTFVVIARGATMRQRLPQQALIRKFVGQVFFEPCSGFLQNCSPGLSER